MLLPRRGEHVKRRSRILVVDDEPRNVRVMERILRPAGFDVITACNGYECLDRVAQFDPDLVILDVMMPGLDGYEITRRIRSHEKTSLTPVLLVSALQGTEDRITGIEAGCDDFICKPFDAREVLARIQTSLTLREEWTRRRETDRLTGERVRRELWRARETQEALLPNEFPRISGAEVWGVNASSTEVSGDYFDVVEIESGGALVLAIADVSGKGLPAALVMSNVQACLRTQLLDGVNDPAVLMRGLNHVVYRATAPDTFVTMWIGSYDCSTRTLRYARAGHEIPYVVRAGGIRTLDEGGPVLGIAPEVEFIAAEEALAPGELLCLYTDGVPDACVHDGEPFGHGRLVEALSSGSGDNAERVGRTILANVRDFIENTSQVDDVTLLLLRVPLVEAAIPTG